jgi:hypothetical protein
MNDQENVFLKDLISSISESLAENPKYQHFKECGPLEVNKYSITFWVNFIEAQEISSIYVKIPAIITKRIEDFNSLETTKSTELAINEYESLKYLFTNWTNDYDVHFVKPLCFIEDKNIIITDRIRGSFLFKDLRKISRKRNSPQNALINFGKSLAHFHKLSEEEVTFETSYVFRKFNLYLNDLKRFSVSDKDLNIIKSFIKEHEQYKSSTQKVYNLKGIDIRQLLYKDNKIFVIDPGKISKGYVEIDLARFMVTMKIINWGSYKLIFKIIFGYQDKINEDNFLNGYSSLKNYSSLSLRFMITKEILKHWKMAHESLQLRKIPSLIKLFIKKFYIDYFYMNLFKQEILLIQSELKPKN